jgi:hypothetical protein
MKYYIYVHRRVSNNTIFYVGKGSNKRAFSKQQRSNFWHSTVAKYGLIVEIIKYFEHECDAFSYEEIFIKELQSNGEKLVNLKDGGLGGVGFHHTAIAKQKISNALKQRIWRQETKNKISNALKNSTFARKRKKKFPSNNRKKLICVTTNEIFDNTHEAAKKLNLSFSNIASVCRGKRKTCGGLIFKYLSEVT